MLIRNTVDSAFRCLILPCTALPSVLPGRRAAGLIYNAFVIALAHAGMVLLTWIFFVGLAGSLLVILISFFEDLNELVGKE